VTPRSWQIARNSFHPKEWADIRAFLGGIAETSPQFTYLVDIIDSIIASDRGAVLGATTWMHDLIIAPLPQMDPPFDVIAVRAPGSLSPPAKGNVLIEHLTVTGRNDRIERPAAEAVPLFWRFAIEKFGTRPPNR
jgi:hypothetical protein